MIARNFWLPFVLALAATLSLAACAGLRAPPPNAPQPTTTQQPSGRGAGDTLRVILWQAPTILNPHFATGGKDAEASRATLEPLASFDAAGQLVPFLAAEIPSRANGGLSADGTTVTWRLKTDVRWSDGEPFSADDVKFTYEFAADPDTAATSARTYRDIAAVEVVDQNTLRVRFSRPTAAWALPFIGTDGMILPRHVFAEYRGARGREAPANLLPVGTGPYRVTEFRPGDLVLYEPNPYFREPDKPFFRRVELKGGGDAATAARAVLQTGEFDFAWNLFLEPNQLAELERTTAGRVLLTPLASSERIVLNHADPLREIDGERASVKAPHPFFSDLRVRQAVTMAIDRAAIATLLFGKGGVPAVNVLLAPAEYVSSNTAAPLDLERAAALLEQAGWLDPDGDGVRAKGGVELDLLFQTTTNPQRQQIQAIVKQALETIGFRVRLKSIDSGLYFSSDATTTDTFRHFYADMQMYTSGNPTPDPTIYMRSWTCAEIPQKANQWSSYNDSRWCNPAYDALYEQAVVELDPENRRRLFIRMNDMVVEEVAAIPLIHRTGVSAISATLDGVVLSPWESNLWLLKDWRRVGS